MSKPILIHEVHDMWPATLIEIGGMSRYNPFVWLMQRAENSAYKHSDSVVSILPNTEEYMRQHGLKGNFYHIPNGIVEEDWKNPEALPKDTEQLLKRLKTDNKFLVGYFGGHALSNALAPLLDAAKVLLASNKYSDIVVVMVGDGVEKQRLQSRIVAEQITNVVMLDPVGKKSIPCLLEMFDCIYIGTADSTLYRFGLGLNKLYDSMMAAKPIILSTNAKDTVIEIAKCGLVVPAESPSGIVDAVISMYEMSPEKRETLGRMGRRVILSDYTYNRLGKEFEAAMRKGEGGKNILYIEHYAGSPEMGMEYRPYYMAREWVKSGNRVDIIAADYSHLRKKNPWPKKNLEEEVIDGINYHWIHTGRYKGNGIKRALTMLEFVGKTILFSKSIAKKIRPDVIIASSTYPLDTWIGQIIRHDTFKIKH